MLPRGRSRRPGVPQDNALYNCITYDRIIDGPTGSSRASRRLQVLVLYPGARGHASETEDEEGDEVTARNRVDYPQGVVAGFCVSELPWPMPNRARWVRWANDMFGGVWHSRVRRLEMQ